MLSSFLLEPVVRAVTDGVKPVKNKNKTVTWVSWVYSRKYNYQDSY
jgi:hypothetical protein